MKSVWIPNANHFAHFFPRDRMRSGRERRMALGAEAWPAPRLPITWYGNLSFPIHGNDTYGDCGIAMAAHGDETFTGANGTESTFSDRDIVSQYLSVSGGDNGLSEQMVVSQIWDTAHGICGNKTAVIYDYLDLDPSSPGVVQSAIGQFGGVCLALSLPDAWIQDWNPNGGTVWDVPAEPDDRNGHFVFINGVDTQGRYRVQTWGSHVWLTQAGMEACNPEIFTVFSPRWFGPTGYDPTGAPYPDKATLWHSVGGRPIVQPGPVVVPPTPVPTPVPTPPPTPTPAPVPPPTPVPPMPNPPHPVPANIRTVGDMIETLNQFWVHAPIVIRGPQHFRFPVVGTYQGMVVLSMGYLDS